ncbi:MAG: alpha/beta hydrolase, partial [Erysipelotrichaceae bacterium]|nr:alpha/beta hydrolase [Erysipelotrichaceae bacterium]
IDIYRMMEEYRGDVLLIHGSNDSIVPFEYTKRAMEHFPNAKLIVLDGAEHGFHGPEREGVVKTVTAYIKERI